MSGTKLIGVALGLGALLFTPSASAAPEGQDLLLVPIEGGYMHNLGRYRGQPDMQLGMLSSGFGYMWDRVGFMAIARVGMGPNRTRLGWGGARGYYALLGNKRFDLGPDLTASLGGGKVLGERSRLLAAIEPGVSARLYTASAGAFEIKANWYQPLSNDQAWGNGAMLSLAWHPLHTVW